MTSHKPTVCAAMSGGVDSCVAAALLLEQGYDVIGMTMRVTPSSAAASAAEDARRAAEWLGIPHHVANYEDRFERDVVQDFVSEYLAGRTPNPCFRCNRKVKFGALLEEAMALGADYFATGHYARTAERGGRVVLRRARYLAKDQTYAMAGLQQEQLRRILYPLGELTKEEVRETARSLDLFTSDKPESQEICFVPGDDYHRFLVERTGPGEPGPIVNRAGEVLGQHKGLMHYTVGQRKGLGIAAPRPLYVLDLDAGRNAVVVGYAEETYFHKLIASEVIWGAMENPGRSFPCWAQIRYNHHPAPATAHVTPDGLEVAFDEPERAVAPGQWAVLYDEEGVVLAAGLIVRGVSVAGETSPPAQG